VAEPGGAEPGWWGEVRTVIVVAAVVVAVVLVVGAVAVLVPPIGDLFARLPIAIVALLVGTGWVLWRITRRPASQ